MGAAALPAAVATPVPKGGCSAAPTWHYHTHIREHPWQGRSTHHELWGQRCHPGLAEQGGTPCASPLPPNVLQFYSPVILLPPVPTTLPISHTPTPITAYSSCRALGVGTQDLGTWGSEHAGPGLGIPGCRAGHPEPGLSIQDQSWAPQCAGQDSQDEGQTPWGQGQTDTHPWQCQRGMGPMCEAPPSCSRQFPSLFSPLLDSSWQDGSYKYT